METYTRELYRELGRMDTGLDFVALASHEGSRMDMSLVPRRGDRARGSAARTDSCGPSASWSPRACTPGDGGADLVHSPRHPRAGAHSMPTVITLHDMLYWSHPELMVDAALHAAGDVDGEARRRQRDARDHRQPGVGGRDLQVPRLPARPAARRAAGRHAPRGRHSATACAENLVLASGQRRPYKNWDGLIRALALVEEDDPPPAGDHRRPRRGPAGAGGRRGRPRRVGGPDAAGSTTTSSPTCRPGHARWRCRRWPRASGCRCWRRWSIGLPVIASDLPVLREVGGDAALWFDPRSTARRSPTRFGRSPRSRSGSAAGAAGLAQAAGSAGAGWPRRPWGLPAGPHRGTVERAECVGSSSRPVPERCRTRRAAATRRAGGRST